MGIKTTTYLDDIKQTYPEIYQELIAFVTSPDTTLPQAAKKFHLQLNQGEEQLLSKLKYYSKKYGWKQEIPEVYRDAAQLDEKKPEDVSKLSPDDIKLLEDFRSGVIGFDVIQKEVALRAFAKVLADPSAVSVADWLKSELVKIKKDELTLKQDQMEKSFNKLFGGFFTPVCPHCGKPLFQEGETAEQNNNEPQSLPA
jgi:hypothetical protein